MQRCISDLFRLLHKAVNSKHEKIDLGLQMTDHELLENVGTAQITICQDTTVRECSEPSTQSHCRTTQMLIWMRLMR
jgi:hypothetical protein